MIFLSIERKTELWCVLIEKYLTRWEAIDPRGIFLQTVDYQRNCAPKSKSAEVETWLVTELNLTRNGVLPATPALFTVR
jgi:hypothetical protein